MLPKKRKGSFSKPPLKRVKRSTDKDVLKKDDSSYASVSGKKKRSKRTHKYNVRYYPRHLVQSFKQQSQQYYQNVQEHPQQRQQNAQSQSQYVQPQSQYVQPQSQYVQPQSQYVQQPYQYVQQPYQYIQQPYQYIQQPYQYVQQPYQYVQQPYQAVQYSAMKRPKSPVQRNSAPRARNSSHVKRHVHTDTKSVKDTNFSRNYRRSPVIVPKIDATTTIDRKGSSGNSSMMGMRLRKITGMKLGKELRKRMPVNSVQTQKDILPIKKRSDWVPNYGNLGLGEKIFGTFRSKKNDSGKKGDQIKISQKVFVWKGKHKIKWINHTAFRVNIKCSVNGTVVKENVIYYFFRVGKKRLKWKEVIQDEHVDNNKKVKYIREKAYHDDVVTKRGGWFYFRDHEDNMYIKVYSKSKPTSFYSVDKK